MKRWGRRTFAILSTLLVLGAEVEPLYAAEVSTGLGVQIEVLEDANEGVENVAVEDDDNHLVDDDVAYNEVTGDDILDNEATDDAASDNENNTTDSNLTDEETEEKREGTEQTEDEEIETDSSEKLLDETTDEGILIEKSGIITNPLYDIDEDAAVREIQELEEQASGFSLFASVRECASDSVAADYVRGEMVARSNSISFLFPKNLYSDNVVKNILDRAVTHTESCSGQEGDALRWGWKAFDGTVAGYSGNWYKITITITYYTDYGQESALTNAVNRAMSSMALGNASEYNKIKAIHDYICDHVNYDYTYSKYSAYEALCTGSAVCQGYAVLFYRMCKEAGLSVRVIPGIGNGGPHAWNIVKLGSHYYNVDCTWDGQDITTYDTWLLKCEADFPDHSRDGDYATSAFHSTYPMSSSSWIDESAMEPAYQMDNLSYTYTTIDGGSVSSTAIGRPKLLVFFRTTCGNSRQTIREICNRNISGVDMIAVEIDRRGKDEVASFRDTYGNSTMLFSYSTGDNNIASLWSYLGKAGINSTVTLPVLVYIDSNNKIQYMSQGFAGGAEVSRNLAWYCGVSSSGWVHTSSGWYYYQQGKNATGWQQISGTWYYFGSDGIMKTGWQQISGTWYYLNGSGAMQTGWLNQGGTWYYLNGSGAMQTGWLNQGGTWYYLNGSGAMQTGWLNQGGTWYYLNGSGAMQTGWLNQGGTWYYLNGSGVMQTGWTKVGNTWYYLNGNGAMQTGWLNQGGTWYYLNGSGAMQIGWAKVGNTWYYLNGNGIMQTGWAKVGNTWYYLNGSGAMQTGWLKLGNTWYYLNSNGVMATGTIMINGERNRFDSSGAWKGSV